ncbi:MAG TPA: heme o synthase [Candidatus Binataceae bacterium]|nr:heme o synthase [Candidatus Binataceae bacterium]
MNAKAAILEAEAGATRARLAAYLELTKPRVVAMVLVTTLAGFYLGGRGGFDFMLAFNLIVGTALAAGGTLALNQYMEADIDALMRRTQHRPLPDGRLRPVEALVFGCAAAGTGFAYLLLATDPLCTAVTAAITAIYLLAYTPLKRRTWLCDVIGAIPGALPPLAGWAAARGNIAAEPLVMVGIMFLWQLPHTFAVARLYREDYARAGIHLLPEDRSWGNPADPVMIGASAGLIAISIAPWMMGFAGAPYGVVAAILGLAMLAFALAMIRAPGRAQAARRLLFASLIYLPIVLLMMVIDKL